MAERAHAWFDLIWQVIDISYIVIKFWQMKMMTFVRYFYIGELWIVYVFSFFLFRFNVPLMTEKKEKKTQNWSNRICIVSFVCRRFYVASYIVYSLGSFKWISYSCWNRIEKRRLSSWCRAVKSLTHALCALFRIPGFIYAVRCTSCAKCVTDDGINYSLHWGGKQPGVP